MVIRDKVIENSSPLLFNINGKYIIERLLEITLVKKFEKIIVVTKNKSVERFLKDHDLYSDLDISVEPIFNKRKDALVLDSNKLYSKKKLLKKMQLNPPEPESAVLHEIKNKNDLKMIGEMLKREDLYKFSFLHHRAAVFISNRLASTQVKANHLTLMGIFLSMLASYSFMLKDVFSLIAGGILINIIWTIDLADGHLARLKGTESRFGFFFDWIADEIFIMLIIIGIIIGLYNAIGSLFVLIVGFLALFSIHMHYVVSKFVYPEGKTEENQNPEGTNEGSIITNLKRFFLLSCDWDATILLITAGAFLNILFYVVAYIMLSRTTLWMSRVIHYYRGMLP